MLTDLVVPERSPLDLADPPDGMTWLDPVAAPGADSPLVLERAGLANCGDDGLEEWLRRRFAGIRELPVEAMEVVPLLDVATYTPVLVAAGDDPSCVTARATGELQGWEMQAADGTLIARAATLDSTFRESDREAFGGFNFGSASFGSGESAAGVSLVVSFESSIEPRGGEERLFVAETPFAVLTDLIQIVTSRQVGWFSTRRLSPAFHSYGSHLPRHVPEGTVRCLGPVDGPEEWHSERQLLCSDDGVVLEILRLNRRPEGRAAETHTGIVEWTTNPDLVANVQTPDDLLEYRFDAGIDEETAAAMVASIPVLDSVVWQPTPTETRVADDLSPDWIASILEGAGVADAGADWQPVMDICQLECFSTEPFQIVEAVGTLEGEGELEVSVMKHPPDQPSWFSNTMAIRHVGGIQIFGDTNPRPTSDTHSVCGDVRIRALVRHDEGLDAGMDRLEPVLDLHAILVDQLGC